MDNDVMIQLAHKLDKKTKTGQLNWVPYGVGVYRLALGDGTIEITYYEEPYITPTGNFGPDYLLQFLNERNEVIGVLSVSETYDLNYDMLKSIYENARSNYLKIDSTFRSMLDALGE